MPLTGALVGVVTHALTNLTWTESFLLGALLSPTDPVLSSPWSRTRACRA